MKYRLTRAMAALASLAVGALLLVSVPAGAAYQTAPRAMWSANKLVYAIAMSPDQQTVYIGGAFTSVKDVTTGTVVPRAGVAAFDAVTGALVDSFDPSFDNTVRAIAVSPVDGTVYVGGAFLSVNGEARTRMAALTPSGAVKQDWLVSASGVVKDLTVVGEHLFLAGQFGTVNGFSRPGLAKVHAATGGTTSWRVPTGGGRANTLVVLGSDLVVGGTFTSLKGEPRAYVGSASIDTATVTPWSPLEVCSGCTVFDLDSDGDAVYGAIGGGGGRAVKWSGDTAALLWRLNGDGDVQAVAVRDGTVYAGGHFGPNFAGTTRNQVAAIDAASGKLLPWAPSLGGNNKPGVWALAPGDDFLRVGGGFGDVEGTGQARYTEFAYVSP